MRWEKRGSKSNRTEILILDDLKQVAANLCYKSSDNNRALGAKGSLWQLDSTQLLWHKSRHEQYIDEFIRLCCHKILYREQAEFGLWTVACKPKWEDRASFIRNRDSRSWSLFAGGGNWQRWGWVEFMCVNLRCSHEFHVKVSSRQFGICSCKNQEGNTDLGVITGMP